MSNETKFRDIVTAEINDLIFEVSENPHLQYPDICKKRIRQSVEVILAAKNGEVQP